MTKGSASVVIDRDPQTVFAVVSDVTRTGEWSPACVPGEVFEFIAEEYTTWRYQLEAVAGGTKVTESFEFSTKNAIEKFGYETVLRRPASMVKGMQRTLDQMKAPPRVASLTERRSSRRRAIRDERGRR